MRNFGIPPHIETETSDIPALVFVVVCAVLLAIAFGSLVAMFKYTGVM